MAGVLVFFVRAASAESVRSVRPWAPQPWKIDCQADLCTLFWQAPEPDRGWPRAEYAVSLRPGTVTGDPEALSDWLGVDIIAFPDLPPGRGLVLRLSDGAAVTLAPRGCRFGDCAFGVRLPAELTRRLINATALILEVPHTRLGLVRKPVPVVGLKEAYGRLARLQQMAPARKRVR